LHTTGTRYNHTTAIGYGSNACSGGNILTVASQSGSMCPQKISDGNSIKHHGVPKPMSQTHETPPTRPLNNQPPHLHNSLHHNIGKSLLCISNGSPNMHLQGTNKQEEILDAASNCPRNPDKNHIGCLLQASNRPPNKLQHHP
jgi:hypothetical protein